MGPEGTTAEISGTLRVQEGKLTITKADETLAWLKGRSFVNGEAVDTRFVKPEDRASVWWQVLAYLILTVAEILISVTGLELAFVIAPQSMKGLITACWLAVVGIANLAVNAPLAKPYAMMTPAVFFGMQIAIMVAVIVSFFFIARRFNRRQAEAAVATPPSDEDEFGAEMA